MEGLNLVEFQVLNPIEEYSYKNMDTFQYAQPLVMGIFFVEESLVWNATAWKTHSKEEKATNGSILLMEAL